MAKAPAKTTKKKSFKKKEKRVIPSGIVHVQASFNNTIITFTDLSGNVLAWSSSGSLGFRGSRKGTPFAAHGIPLRHLLLKRFAAGGKLIMDLLQRRFRAILSQGVLRRSSRFERGQITTIVPVLAVGRGQSVVGSIVV